MQVNGLWNPIMKYIEYIGVGDCQTTGYYHPASVRAYIDSSYTEKTLGFRITLHF